jgi:hypothetical protein
MIRASAVAVIVAVAVGCGPIRYTGEIRRASEAVAAARAAHADTYAPYWWTRATQYLHKAREVAGRADFAAANRYGRLAAAAANLAAQEATVAAKAAPPVAPAKATP